VRAIPIDDYFAAVESRFESPSPYGRHQEGEDVNEYKCDQCDRTFDTEQGLRVHRGRAHSKMARKPKADHPWRSPAVMPDTAPEQKVDAGEEPIPDKGSVTLADLARDGIGLHFAPDYRMELIETLADLAACQLGLMADADTVAEVGPTIARIKAVAQHE
jgi:hypothetical protein